MTFVLSYTCHVEDRVKCHVLAGNVNGIWLYPSHVIHTWIFLRPVDHFTGYRLTWIQKEGKLFFVQLSVSVPVGSRKSSPSELNELFVRQLQTSVVDCIGVCKHERSLPQEVLLVACWGEFIKDTLGPIVAISGIWGLHKAYGTLYGG